MPANISSFADSELLGSVDCQLAPYRLVELRGRSWASE
jgi:hypothetical protein